MNADGYVSTGTGILGFNMFAYCNNNPVNFADPTGTCITNAMGMTIHHNCKYMYIDSKAQNSVLVNMAMSKEVVGAGTSWVISIVKDTYEKAPKPKHVGIGTFRKDKYNKINQIDNLSRRINEVMDMADFIIINGEIVYGVYGNCQNQASDIKIVWDVMVDGAVLGTNAYTASYVSATTMAMIGGPIGVTVGICAGAGAGFLLGVVGDEARKEAKGWIR